MRSIGKVLPIPVGKQLKMCELSSRSRTQAATSAYIYHMQSPVQLSFSQQNTWKSFKVDGREGWKDCNCE